MSNICVFSDRNTNQAQILCPDFFQVYF